MRRRDFITLLGGAATAWPLAARAQQPAMPVIGFLGPTTSSSWNLWTPAFAQRLHELGWVEGRTVAIEFRWADGRTERMAEIADEFVRRKVDIIVTGGGGILAAKQATSVIPIVFALAVDPLGLGAVASLARPGGNVTGLSLQSPDLAGKRVELLREVIPGLRRLAIFANVGYPSAALELREVQDIARTLGLDVTALEVRRAADIAPAFEASKDRADALYLCGDAFVLTHRARILPLALIARWPMISGLRESVHEGGLMSYGPSIPDMFRRSAELVDKILRGAKAAEIPVEQPTKFDLVINLTIAKALGLTVPDKLLALADEVIE